MGSKKPRTSIEFLKPIGTNKPETDSLDNLLEYSAEAPVAQAEIIQPTMMKRLIDLPSELVDFLLNVVFEKCFSSLKNLTVENLLSCLKGIWNIQDPKPFRHQHPGELTQNGVSFRLRGQPDKVFVTPNEIQNKLAIILS